MAPKKATMAASKTAKETSTTKKTAAGKESDGVKKTVAKPAAKKTASTKKATTTSSKEVTKKEPAAKKAPAAKKEPAAKKTTAATMKASTKATVATETAAATKKRKVEEEMEDGTEAEAEEPKANTSKRRKVSDESVSPTVPSKRPITAAKKPKVVKPKIVINNPPTQRLDIYVSGEGSQGELGLGTGTSSMNALKPRLNPQLSAANIGVVQLATGGMHCAALTHNNMILTWGVNDEGALGRDTQWDGGMVEVDDFNSDESSEDADLNPREATPTPVEFTDLPEGTIFTQITAGDSSTFALTDEGQVYGWGTFRASPLLPADPTDTDHASCRVTTAS
jgi:regulator of chromosome condensation